MRTLIPIRIPESEKEVLREFDEYMLTTTEKDHIVKISAFNTKMTSLPENIGNLTSLKVLDLVRNQLTSLPESIGDLTSLRVLDLSRNKLISLPESIGNLVSLKELRN